MSGPVKIKSYGRKRFEDGIIRPIVPVQMTLTQTAATQNTYKTTPIGPFKTAYEGTARSCRDVVTPNYRRLIEAGKILNNPFWSAKVTCEHGGFAQKTSGGAAPNPWRADVTVANDVQHILRGDSRFLFGSPFDVDGDIPGELVRNVDIPRLITRTSTSALAKVDEGNAALAVTLGEMRETLTLLREPLSSLLSFLKKNKSLIKRLRRDLPDYETLVKGIYGSLADDYLKFYFGVMPIFRDFESLVDAYVQAGAAPERVTARSDESDSYKASVSYSHLPLKQGISTYAVTTSYEEVVTVRSGILYSPSVSTYVKQFGLRFTDLPSAAWQLLPWSFFVDYFLNIGKIIRALTPRPDVSYFAAWNTVKCVITDSARCTGGGAGGWNWDRVNSEWSRRVIETTLRTPVSPYANAGFSASLGSWDSALKQLATISLAIQALVLH